VIHASTKARRVPFDARAIGQRIRAARLSRKWTQADLAAAMGLAATTIACWECGVRTPATRMLGDLSLHLRRTLDWLVCGREKNAQVSPLNGPDGAPQSPADAPPAPWFLA
jgi:transcriptional regulator with XRE-family HTH domain